MKMTRAVRWKYIRNEIRDKGLVRWGTVVLAKWFLDRALRDGHGSVDAVVLTEGGCCASFDIQSTRWNCGIPGGELTIVVDPIMAGGNCTAWSHIHENDHIVATSPPPGAVTLPINCHECGFLRDFHDADWDDKTCICRCPTCGRRSREAVGFGEVFCPCPDPEEEAFFAREEERQ